MSTVGVAFSVVLCAGALRWCVVYCKLRDASNCDTARVEVVRVCLRDVGMRGVVMFLLLFWLS